MAYFWYKFTEVTLVSTIFKAISVDLNDQKNVEDKFFVVVAQLNWKFYLNKQKKEEASAQIKSNFESSWEHRNVLRNQQNQFTIASFFALDLLFQHSKWNQESEITRKYTNEMYVLYIFIFCFFFQKFRSIFLLQKGKISKINTI